MTSHKGIYRHDGRHRARPQSDELPTALANHAAVKADDAVLDALAHGAPGYDELTTTLARARDLVRHPPVGPALPTLVTTDVACLVIQAARRRPSAVRRLWRALLGTQ